MNFKNCSLLYILLYNKGIFHFIKIYLDIAAMPILCKYRKNDTIWIAKSSVGKIIIAESKLKIPNLNANSIAW